MSKFLIVDGNSILNRAFYGIRPLTASDGTPTNALFGFINILKKHMDFLHPEYLVCAFDLKAPTFRHKMYDAYKAGRHPMPEELAVQLPIAKELATAMGFTVISEVGYEADDILGTVSVMGSSAGHEVFLLTGDRDSLQLISDKTTVILVKTKEDLFFDVPLFKETYGILPSQVVDVKALMGDTSDNIPGVSGIGEKTALKLITSFGSLENLYENLAASDLTASVKAKLESGKENAFFSRSLSQICLEVPLGITVDTLKSNGPDKKSLSEMFRRLEFTVFDKRFELDSGANEESTKQTFPTTESVGIEALSTNLPLSLVIGEISEDTAILYLSDGTRLYRCDCSVDTLKEFLLSRDILCHDLKNLCRTLLPLGVQPHCTFDTMLAAYLLQPGESHYPLGRIAKRYLHLATDELSPAENAFAIAVLFPVLQTELENANMLALLHDIEIPLAPVLAEMESIGFRLDSEGLAKYAAELGATATALEEVIYMNAGKTFNLNSPKQLSEVLYNQLGLPTGKKTQSGYSTDAETLEKLRPYHPIIEHILDYRTITKLKNTYGDALIPLVDENSRIHTTFNQTGTATGRLSSADPNLQNIPVRGQLGRELRKFFTADGGGRTLLDADYSQIELRLLAELSGDTVMSNAFIDGVDIHAVTASQVFHVPLEAVTSDLRSKAKAVNFGIVYGIGDFSLAQDLKISRRMAADYITNYLATYPSVDLYLKNAVATAREQGFATTKFGRRRPLPELSAKNKNLQAFGERVAMNSPIQGTAADVIKLAMIRVHTALKDSGIDARLILQVHDELIVECAESCKAEAEKILKEAMENAVKTTVPLLVDISSGFTWFDAK